MEDYGYNEKENTRQEETILLSVYYNHHVHINKLNYPSRCYITVSDNEIRPQTDANTLQNLAISNSCCVETQFSFHLSLNSTVILTVNYINYHECQIVPLSFISTNPPLVWHEYFAVLEKDHSCKVPHPSMSIKEKFIW